MQRANEILKGLALATCVVVGVFLCIFIGNLNAALTKQSGSFASVLAQTNSALVTINRPCAPGPCGTLAEVDKLSTHASDLIVQSQLAVRHADQVSLTEQTMLPEWNRQITQTLQSVSRTTETANTQIAQIGSRASALLETTNTTVGAAQPLLGHADALVGHSDAFIQTLPPISANVREITAQAAIITKDAKVEEQRFVYPPATPWYKKIMPTILRSGELAYDFIR